jgi:hypothetical protein
MKINWTKMRKLAFTTIDQFSEVANFLNKNKSYFYTVMKYNVFFAILLTVLGAISFLLTISITSMIPLSFIILFAVILFFIYAYGLNFGLVFMLMKKKKPTLTNLLSSISGNLGFIFQLSVTGVLIGLGLGLIFLLFSGIIMLVDLVPLVNLSELASKIIFAPMGILVNFVLVHMSILYLQGKRGWIKLPEKAINMITAKKEIYFSLALGLAFITSTISVFFNGLIFIFFVLFLITIPLLQSINVLVPYFFYFKKKKA